MPKTKARPPKRRNLEAASLINSKYRQRVIPNKRKKSAREACRRPAKE